MRSSYPGGEQTWPHPQSLVLYVACLKRYPVLTGRGQPLTSIDMKMSVVRLHCGVVLLFLDWIRVEEEKETL